MCNLKHLIFLLFILFVYSINAQEFEFIINSPIEVAGKYKLYKSTFGPKDTFGIIEKDLILSSPLSACGGIINDIANKIVFIDRGPCNSPNENDGNFISKIRYAQNANAIAVVICNNENPIVNPGLPVGDIDNITIKSFLMGKPDCEKIKLALFNNSIQVSINHKLCVPSDTSSNIIWGSKLGEGDFAYGLNGWTINRYEKDSLKWWPSGKINNSYTFNSYSQCNGIAIMYNSDEVSCDKCKNSLISPNIDVQNVSRFGLKIEFNQLASDFYNLGYSSKRLFVSKDNGITWKDSFEVGNTMFQSIQLKGFYNVSNIRLKFEGYKEYSGVYWWAIDDVVVKTYPESSCGVMYINSQDDIQYYADKYPGCTEVANLQIINFQSDNYEIDFTPLNIITTIGGNIKIDGCKNLTFKGDILPNLKFVGEDFLITNNANLKEMKGFDNLNKINGNLSISGNVNTNFPKLIGIDTLNSNYSFSSNTDCDIINIIPNLKVVKGSYSCSYNTILNDTLNLTNIEIANELNINGNNNLVNIQGSNKLVYVKSIGISDNKSLSHIEGFNSIQSSNFIRISNNDTEILDILNNLKTIVYGLDVSKNNNLKLLAGFNKLDSLTSLWIDFNIKLEEINGFQNLSKVKEYLYLRNNNSFNDCFKSLKHVGGLYISNNSNLKNLDAFDFLVSAFPISIINNPSLNAIEGFNKLENASIEIKNNNSLQVINAFNNLKYLFWLSLFENKELTNVSSFDSVISIGSIQIENNSKIKRIFAFENVLQACCPSDRINLSITNNSNLNHITCFNKILKINDGINISNNSTLDSIHFLENVRFIGGRFNIESNPKLKTINDLIYLDTINSFLKLNYNAFKGLNFIQNLKYVNGSIFLSNNKELKTIKSLNKLKRVNGSLNIFENDSLNSLYGLENINSNSISSIKIEDNPLLDTCHVKSICLFLDDNSEDAKIAGNEYNCGSIVKVKEACNKTTGIKNHLYAPIITIYPNPTSSMVILSISKSIEVIICDILGRELHKQIVNTDNNVVDVSNLPRGILIFKFGNQNRIVVKQ